MDIKDDQPPWYISFFIKYHKEKGQLIKLANELQKPIIRKFNKRKVHYSFKYNICGVDLADMPLLSKFNKRFRFLLCVFDIFSKYAWVVSVKDKKGISIVNAFQIILKESNHKT